MPREKAVERAAAHRQRNAPGATIWPRVQASLLRVFFMALAVSISASQILQAALVALMSVRATPEHGLGIRRARWTDFAPLRRHPLTGPFLVFTGLTVLAALHSGNPGRSLWIARDTLRITVFYLALWYVRDAAHADTLWRGFLGVLTLMAGYGLAQAWSCRARPQVLPAAWLAQACTHPHRIRGPFSIYMTFADVLMLGALVCLAALATLPWRRTWWMGPATGLIGVALTATGARHAWVGLAVGVLVLGMTARRLVLASTGLLLVILVAVGATPAPVRHRVQSIVDLQDVTVRDRLAMWRSGVQMIRDHLLLGVGPGQVRAWYPSYRRPEAVRPSTGHLHSSPIQIAAERGLPALAVWLWLWIVFFREGRHVLRELGEARSEGRALVCGSLAAVAGFLVAGLFQHSFGDGDVVLIVYALMALPFTVTRGLAAGAT
jgi:O-antigen ligase